ncbi:hypothetical protein [Ectothiorhodospira shaposhnikovii]|uniref:hypothetical protein n=1 Tax=Ectothiorhodospira shaposhnikovii TaxID=1054 RepID=UPI0039A32BFB
MQVHTYPIEERIQWLINLSRKHSELFCSPAASLARDRYLARHSTRIAVLKCMDGRIHIPHATRTPLGIIRPFRNLGGRFDLGWPFLGKLIAEMAQDAASAGHRVLLMITYPGAIVRGAVPVSATTPRPPSPTPIRFVLRQRPCSAVTGSRCTRWSAASRPIAMP